jgi:hypothetical protein
MEYKLNELGDCIFAYLVSNADLPISIDRIYYDITGQTGHRCKSLISSSTQLNDRKDMFVEKCFCLPSEFDNIEKIFRDGDLYLVFNKNNNYWNYKNDNENYNTKLNINKNNDNVNIDLTLNYDIHDTINGLLRKKEWVEKLTTEEFIDNFAEGKSLLEIICEKDFDYDRIYNLLNHFDKFIVNDFAHENNVLKKIRKMRNYDLVDIIYQFKNNKMLSTISKIKNDVNEQINEQVDKKLLRLMNNRKIRQNKQFGPCDNLALILGYGLQLTIGLACAGMGFYYLI